MSESDSPEPKESFDPGAEEIYERFMAMIREQDAREALGEPIRTPEQEQAWQEYLDKLNELTANIPPDATDEEIIRIADESDIKEPFFDDQLWDFRDSN